MSLLTNMNLEGLDSAKPAAGNAGRLYFATDTNIIYKDNGTAWVPMIDAVYPAAVQDQSYVYAADSGVANAYAAALSPAPTLVAGSIVVFKATNANTGASTLAVNGGSAITINKQGSTALASGDIVAGQIIAVVYDGTNFQLIAGAGSGGGLSNPLTTQGDLFVGGASGAPARLAAGTSGYVLTSNGPSTTPTYQPVSGGGGGGGGSTVSILNVSLAPTAAGAFVVAHGLGAVPTAVAIVMTSGGQIYLQTPTSYDGTNIYLDASDASVTGIAIVIGVTSGGGGGGGGITVTNVSFGSYTPDANGNFTVAHGLGFAPSSVSIQMTSAGQVWFQSPASDATNLYLTASDAGLTGNVLCFT